MSKVPSGPQKIMLNSIIVVLTTGDPEQDAEAVRQVLKNKGLHKEASQFQAVFYQALAFANTSSYLYECSPRNTASVVPLELLARDSTVNAKPI